jgi:hypothetical protein
VVSVVCSGRVTPVGLGMSKLKGALAEEVLCILPAGCHLPHHERVYSVNTAWEALSLMRGGPRFALLPPLRAKPTTVSYVAVTESDERTRFVEVLVLEDKDASDGHVLLGQLHLDARKALARGLDAGTSEVVLSECIDLGLGQPRRGRVVVSAGPGGNVLADPMLSLAVATGRVFQTFKRGANVTVLSECHSLGRLVACAFPPERRDHVVDLLRSKADGVVLVAHDCPLRQLLIDAGIPCQSGHHLSDVLAAIPTLTPLPPPPAIAGWGDPVPAHRSLGGQHPEDDGNFNFSHPDIYGLIYSKILTADCTGAALRPSDRPWFVRARVVVAPLGSYPGVPRCGLPAQPTLPVQDAAGARPPAHLPRRPPGALTSLPGHSPPDLRCLMARL